MSEEETMSGTVDLNTGEVYVEREEMLAETIHGEMRDAILTEIKAAGRSWQEMPQHEQERVIYRIDKRVESILAGVVRTLVGHDFPEVEGALEQITVKDGLKLVVKVSATAHDRFEVVDAVGSHVRVVVADHRVFTGKPGQVTSDSDQRDLPLAQAGEGEEPDAGGTDDAEDPEVEEPLT